VNIFVVGMIQLSRRRSACSWSQRWYLSCYSAWPSYCWQFNIWDIADSLDNHVSPHTVLFTRFFNFCSGAGVLCP